MNLEVQNKILKITERLHGHIDDGKFKDYVFGFLFYKLLSTRLANYLTAEGIDHLNIREEIKKRVKNKLGYWIDHKDLFNNVIEQPEDNLNIKLSATLNRIQENAYEYYSDIFNDVDLNNEAFGHNKEETNKQLKAILKGINEIDLIAGGDTLGDAYEFLIRNYLNNSGRLGGEFYTPQAIGDLMKRIVEANKSIFSSVYDPTCGSGGLLLKFKDRAGVYFYGQDISKPAVRLCRMNMVANYLNFRAVDIKNGDTLVNDKHEGFKFDVIVSNPPYSLKGRQEDKTDKKSKYGNDPRFKEAGALAPKQRADFAFILHCLHHLKDDGISVIVCFPGIFYRDRSELVIRKWLVDNDYIDSVISLSEGLFYKTSIAVNLLVLNKNKQHKNKVLFINAESYRDKAAEGYEMKEEHIKAIEEIYKAKNDMVGVCKLVDIEAIKARDYNMTVSSFIDFAEEPEEEIDIIEKEREIQKRREKLIGIWEQLDRLAFRTNHSDGSQKDGSGGIGVNLVEQPKEYLKANKAAKQLN